MPNVLFVHNGSPGRFAFVAKALRERGWTGALINGVAGTSLEGMATVRWELKKDVQESSRKLVRQAEAQLAAGFASAHAAMRLRESGFSPDLIVGHPAWGEMLFLNEVFPDAPQIQVGEFYYRTRETNFNFDPEFASAKLDASVFQVAGNAGLALSHTHADRIVVPTPFQASTFPEVFQPLIRVIHEGVDTAAAKPRAGARLELGDGTRLDGSVPVITFVNRFFEPLRGFHVFMRALPRFLAKMPNAHVVIVGGDGGDIYGPKSTDGTWKQKMLAEVGEQLDASRVHWTGQLSYPDLLKVFAVSWAHVYLTYPFVLSWSLLDAMACGCLVIGSDTAPVRDLIQHGENGLLVDFFDIDGLVERMAEACREPARFSPLRERARETVVSEYDRATVCLPAWLGLVDEVVG
jgi:glycosyltransferase involved in cell wall biosynthesis